MGAVRVRMKNRRPQLINEIRYVWQDYWDSHKKSKQMREPWLAGPVRSAAQDVTWLPSDLCQNNNTRDIGGKAYADIPVQSVWNPSTAQAQGWK